MYYFNFGAIDEAKRDHGDGCSSRDESNGGRLQDTLNFYDTPTCFDSILLIVLECSYSFHSQELDHIAKFLNNEERCGYVKSPKYHLSL